MSRNREGGEVDTSAAMHGRVCPWVTCLLLCACFRDASALPTPVPSPEVAQWSVRDARDVPWQPDQAPRAPRFFVRFERPLPASLAAVPPLYLVRGALDEELADDLAHPPHRKQTVARLSPLETEATSAHTLKAQSPESLEPGATYTLVWASRDAPHALPLRVSRSPSAGARFVESWPADGARAVPPNLAQVLLRFDGFLEAPPTVELRGGEGESALFLSASLTRCGARGLPEGDCLWIDVGTLAPDTAYQLHFAGAPHDVTGTPLSVPDVSFRTAAQPDTTAPNLANLSCALDEQPWDAGCLLVGEDSLVVRARADEPALMELIAPAQRAAALSFTEPLALSVGELEASACVFVRLTDLAGNQRQWPLCVALPQDLPSLSIDEVHVDPLGPEPAQEYVELLNFGAQAVSMHGFSLTTDPFAEGIVLSDTTPVQPGERVLLVSAQFDRQDAHDAMIPSALRLVRLPRPLSLRNDGVALFLRDDQMRRISASPRMAPQAPGQCIGRVGDDPRSGDPEQFVLDPNGSCTPGAETRVLPP